jgi:hypothetical protein
MADNQAALKLTETWARAATLTSSHERDYFVEAIREMQRQKEAQPSVPIPSNAVPTAGQPD